MAKKHTAKAKADKIAKQTKTEGKRILKIDEKISYKSHYNPGFWRSAEEVKVKPKVSYTPRYVPGLWRTTKEPSQLENKTRYIPGW